MAEIPRGMSVAGTVREVIQLASKSPKKARHWLSHTSDQRAARRVAADVGWDSADIDEQSFQDWLAMLTPEAAQMAIEGRLERISSDNPEGLTAALDEYQDQYDLDYFTYLMVARLYDEFPDGNLVAAPELIARISSPQLAALAEGLSASSQVSSSASVAMGIKGSVSIEESSSSRSIAMVMDAWRNEDLNEVLEYLANREDFDQRMLERLTSNRLRP
ncbi:MAG: hypothetical protein ABF333_15340 [Akkermansiaceae bacterium]